MLVLEYIFSFTPELNASAEYVVAFWNSYHYNYSADYSNCQRPAQIGRTLAKFNQLKRNKRFDNFIMLVWVQGSLFHIAARSHSVQEAWRSQDSLYRGQIQSCFNVVENHTNRFLLLWFRKSIVWPIYDKTFRNYWRKGQRSNVWLYRGQTDENAPILLTMDSKCPSSKYNSNSEYIAICSMYIFLHIYFSFFA